ncbi:MAG: N-acetylmuramoyl-L-alanine amidase family protein, partial [Mobilitalea sp.]
MLINIDAGHNIDTDGKESPPMPRDIDINQDGIIDVKKGKKLKEHTANVGVANYLVDELERCGFETMRTGWNDGDASDDMNPYKSESDDLVARQRSVAVASCGYSISIHFNAYSDGASFNSAQGIGIYIHDQYIEQSEKLAKVILKHLSKGSKQKNRGVTKKSLAMCNCKNLNVKGAIIVELAFMTNLREVTELMASEAYWKESAIEIAKGLCEYTGMKYIERVTIPTKTITVNSTPQVINWLQAHLNAIVGGVYQLELTGI